jgi:phosphinothricin acetyltransferase
MHTTPDGLVIREATDADLPAITALLNRSILTSTASWALTPKTEAEMAGWLDARRRNGFAALVAERDGRFAGHGAYATFRATEGYALTVEHSVYVHPEAQGQGVGAALIEALAARAASAGFHAMIGCIGSENAASLRLHARLGFREAGRLPEIGRKFDRWLDLVLMIRHL